MKQRLISVAVGLCLLAAVMVWYDTALVPVVFSIIGVLAIYEGARALGVNDSIVLTATMCLAHVVNVVFLPDPQYFVYILLFLMFAVIMGSRKRHYTYKEGAGFFTLVLMVTMGFGSIARMRVMSPVYADKLFMLGMGLALGWICDTFAFTFGKLMGKRKLCPEISPNKTVEGAVGGVVMTTVFTVAAMLIYVANAPAGSLFAGLDDPAHIAVYAAMGFVGAIVGIIGDLAASYIKRECGIKDFGNIMPGHGGALDRMDSVLFTSTFAAICFEVLFSIG